MAKQFTRKGQLHYCSLITSLVDDLAIQQQILSAKNATPVLFYFMRIAKNEEVLDWMTDNKGDLKENRWLQILNVLIAEDIFIVGKKSTLSAFLLEHSYLHTISNSRNIQATLCRSIDPQIERQLMQAYQESFC